jgi:hypothetical protein
MQLRPARWFGRGGLFAGNHLRERCAASRASLSPSEKGRGCPRRRAPQTTRISTATVTMTLIVIMITVVINLGLASLPSYFLSVDFVNSTVGEGHKIQLAIRSGLNVGDDTKVGPEQQALTLGDVELV